MTAIKVLAFELEESSVLSIFISVHKSAAVITKQNNPLATDRLTFGQQSLTMFYKYHKVRKRTLNKCLIFRIISCRRFCLY